MIALLIDESGCEVSDNVNFRHDVCVRYDDIFDNTASGKSVICVTVLICLWRLLLRVSTMIYQYSKDVSVVIEESSLIKRGGC